MQAPEFLALSPGAQLPLLVTSLEQGQIELLTWFCDQHSSGDKIVSESFLTDMAAAETFIALTVEKTEPALFAACMKICARIDGLEQTVCHAGGLAKLVQGLQSHPTDTQLVKNTFQTLGFLGSNTHVRENTFYLDGAIGLSVKMLIQYQNDPTVCVCIVAALTNFFYRCVKNKLAFANEGGIAALLPLLKSTPPEPLALALSLTLHNLCNQKMENRMEMMSLGLIRNLIDLSQQHISNAKIQQNVLWALLNLTLNSRAAKGEVNQNGGISAIFQILNTHPEDQSVVYLAVTLLNQLSTRTTTRVAVAGQGAVHLILDVLWRFPQNGNIQLMCLKTLDILCTLSSCRKRLAEGDRLSKLVAWLMEKMDERRFIEAGLNVCWKLSISSGDSRRELSEAGGPTLFNAVNAHYSHDQELTCTCVQCSYSLIEPADYENESSDEEVLSTDAEEGGTD